MKSPSDHYPCQAPSLRVQQTQDLLARGQVSWSRGEFLHLKPENHSSWAGQWELAWPRELCRHCPFKHSETSATSDTGGFFLWGSRSWVTTRKSRGDSSLILGADGPPIPWPLFSLIMRSPGWGDFSLLCLRSNLSGEAWPHFIGQEFVCVRWTSFLSWAHLPPSWLSVALEGLL